ncbi:outer membrane beta-barrel protein [Aquisalimonas asiatica]|uniref:Opacity protein n=1 Tax=Aquisalimonas asiatica TaxID=406100 RepID=A0A1H8PLI5_9GAMM|nr:outer membrane beta-barrel protein [Aquisalimonas asiatica]SEO42578.1 Opacity protein [Aquisalimonas asiatica]
MKRIMVSALLCAMAAPAWSSDFYASVNFGASNWDTEFNEDFNFDGSLSGGKWRRGDVAGGVRLGYQLNDLVAAEIGYQSLGRSYYEGRSTGSGSFYCRGAVDAEVSGSAWDATLVGTFPVIDAIHIMGRAGLARWSAEAEVNDSCGRVSASDSGTDPTIGLGLHIAPNDRIAFRVEGQQYRNVGSDYDVNVFSLGFLGRF